jgi:hypothetical protein
MKVAVPRSRIVQARLGSWHRLVPRYLTAIGTGARIQREILRIDTTSVPTSIKEIIFPVAFLAFVACLGFGTFLGLKMIHEINQAEGRPGRIFFGRGFYLLYRHEQACPSGESTRVVYVLLSVVSVVLFFLLCKLWYG